GQRASGKLTRPSSGGADAKLPRPRSSAHVPLPEPPRQTGVGLLKYRQNSIFCRELADRLWRMRLRRMNSAASKVSFHPAGIAGPAGRRARYDPPSDVEQGRDAFSIQSRVMLGALPP